MSASRITTKLFQLYDQKKTGYLTHNEIHLLITDIYRLINKSFIPSKKDVEGYIDILDKDRDGRLSVQDVENMVQQMGLAFYERQSQTPSRQGNSLIEERLKVARSVFKKFDTQNRGVLDESGIKNLMEETQRLMGSNKQVSQDEVKNYMKLLDANNQGFISLADYEKFMVESLQRQGLIYQ